MTGGNGTLLWKGWLVWLLYFCEKAIMWDLVVFEKDKILSKALTWYSFAFVNSVQCSSGWCSGFDLITTVEKQSKYKTEEWLTAKITRIITNGKSPVWVFLLKPLDWKGLPAAQEGRLLSISILPRNFKVSGKLLKFILTCTILFSSAAIKNAAH